MRKISLKNLNLKEVEQLSREQLKSVLGGVSVSGSGGEGQWCRCGPNADCYVLGLPDRNCTEICQGFENGC